MTEIEAVWQKNLDDLHLGVFGSNLNSPKTILGYWKAQAEAQYPMADEKVKYWEDFVARDEQIRAARQNRK